MPVRNRARKFASLLLVASTSLVFLACPAPTPDQDPFYQPPDPLPGGAPGDVIRSRSRRFSLDPSSQTADPDVQSWQVLYLSESALGDPIAVSGTVLVPKAPWLGLGPRPLVSWAVGTRGLGDQCAPSYTLSVGADYEGLFIKAALGLGFAVAVSDYEGLGTPGTHTYVVGQSEGRAVLNMARAAQRLPEAGLGPNTPVGLFGYSQGGGAAAWAAELAGSYAPELDIEGLAAGGIPSDLAAVAELVDGTPFVAFALMASIGLDVAYPELDLASYLNATGEQLLEEADDVCLVDFDGIATLFSTAFTSRDDYTTTDPLSVPAWQDRLAENELGQSPPDFPIYQFHGLVDEIVPYPQAADLRRTWCDQGANVTWSVLPGEHVLAMVEGLPPALYWLANRFAGLPTWGNCWLP